MLCALVTDCYKTGEVVKTGLYVTNKKSYFMDFIGDHVQDL